MGGISPPLPMVIPGTKTALLVISPPLYFFANSSTAYEGIINGCKEGKDELMGGMKSG